MLGEKPVASLSGAFLHFAGYFDSFRNEPQTRFRMKIVLSLSSHIPSSTCLHRCWIQKLHGTCYTDKYLAKQTGVDTDWVAADDVFFIGQVLDTAKDLKLRQNLVRSRQIHNAVLGQFTLPPVQRFCLGILAIRVLARNKLVLRHRPEAFVAAAN